MTIFRAFLLSATAFLLCYHPASAKTGGVKNPPVQEEEEPPTPPPRPLRRKKDKVVSFQPTFRFSSDKLDQVLALNSRFIAKARNEVDIVHYAIGAYPEELPSPSNTTSSSSNTTSSASNTTSPSFYLSHTREGFLDTQGLLFHATNVGQEFQELLNLTEVVRFEAIGPKKELDKLKEPFDGLGVIYYPLMKGGFRRDIDIMTPQDDHVVSFQPTFKIHPGKFKEAEKLNSRFIKKAETEPGIVFYAIGVNEERMESHTREGFVDADALLFHAGNVADEFAELLALSDFVRADVIGPAEELEKLKEPLSGLAPLYYFPIDPKESFRYDLGEN